MFRVICASEKTDIFGSRPSGTILISNTTDNNHILLDTAGHLDNAASVPIYVKRIPAGCYKISNVRWIGERYYQEFDTYFKVKGNQVFYVGDIVLSPDAKHMFIIDNSNAVRRKLAEQYPELLNRLKFNETTDLEFNYEKYKKYMK